MARDDEKKPELPRLLGGRYRPRWKDPPAGSEPDTAPSLVARDTIVDRELDLWRLEHGPARAAERDARVASLRARTTVLSPSLVAVHDAGEWQDDAFLLMEQVQAPEAMTDALTAAEPPSLAERLRWGVALVDAALAVDKAGLALEDGAWDAVVIDGYRVPRVRGLDRATERTDERRSATVKALGRLLATLVPEGDEERASREALREISEATARGELSLEALRARVGALSGAPERERALLPNIDAETLKRREARVLYAGLAFFVLAFVVLVLALGTLR
jgi:hypothetical protein